MLWLKDAASAGKVDPSVKLVRGIQDETCTKEETSWS